MVVAMTGEILLRAERLHRRYGGLTAVNGVSIAVARGELLGLIGPNGAGKTTMIRLLTGIERPDLGEVFIAHTNVTRFTTDRRVRYGLALTHQIVQPLHGLTVLENVLVAAGIANTRSGVISLFKYRRSTETAAAMAILARLGLQDDANLQPAALPLGKLKRLEVARALALNPRVLLLDEPLAGLNQREAATLAEFVASLHGEGLSIVLIEHNLHEVLRLVTRLLVLDRGQVIADGPPDDVIQRDNVRDAYLGEGRHHA